MHIHNITPTPRRHLTRLAAAALAPLLILAGCSGGSGGEEESTATPSPTSTYDTTISWLSQTDWDAHPSTGADLVFFGQIEAPVSASDLMGHATSASIFVYDGDSRDSVVTITKPAEALTSQAVKPSKETGDTLVMDDQLGDVTLDLHYELSDDATPISEVFSRGLFDIAYTPDEYADLSTILGLGTSTASATPGASASEGDGETTHGNPDLDAAVSYYGAPDSIWYWDDTSVFNPLSPESGGSYELCWIRDDYAFTITVGEVPGYEDSIVTTSFSYYSNAAWDVFEQQLEDGHIAGLAEDVDDAVTYMPFDEFKDEYISGKAAAEASASASASAAASASASASASTSAEATEETTGEATEGAADSPSPSES